MVKVIQPNLAGGEVSDAIAARVDIDKYKTSVYKSENFFPQIHGGLTNRPGLQFIAEAKGTGTTRLIPFEYNTTQTYVLELGDQYMRVFKDAGQVLDTSVSLTVTGVTAADPVVVTTSTSHGLSNGESVYISGVSGMTQLNGRTFNITSLTSTTFSLQNSAGADIDGSGYTAYTSGGTADKVFELATPYAASDIFDLEYTQSADVMTLTHPSYAPRDLTRTDHDAWTLSTITFAPSQAAPTSVSVTATGGSTTFTYAVTAVNEETLEESLPATGSSSTSKDTSWDNTVTWSAAAGAGTYNIYREKNGIYGFVGRAEGTSFNDDNILPDGSDTPPKARNPFNATGDYPSTVGYYQQRRIFANTDNDTQKFFMSQTGNISNMSFSSPQKDDDAITVTIASRQVNEIRHFVSLSDLVILTSGGEWLVEGIDGVITPSGIQVKPQSYYGSTRLTPIVAGDIVIYMQPGQTVRDLGYKFESDSYSGNDLSVLARHLFDYNTLSDWSFAQAPHNLIWCVRDDGICLSLTYSREQNVFGWARHTTQGDFKSVAAIREGDDDFSYFLVERTVNGSTMKYVERMQTRDFTDIQDSFFVDSGLTLDNPVDISGFTNANPVVITTATAHGLTNGDTVDISGIKVSDSSTTRGWAYDTDLEGSGYTVANVTSTTFELQNNGSNVNGTAFKTYHSGGKVREAVTSISGLWHLEGQAVVALGNGYVERNLTVSGGGVTLQNKASRVHIGLPYTSEMQTLRIDNGNVMDTIQGRNKKISRLSIRFEQSLGGWYGPDLDHMREIKYGLPAQYGQTPDWITGDKDLTMSPSWNKDGQIVVQQRDPLPMTLLALIPEVIPGGN
ncbi:MAG: ubiquitin-activating E1 FCCH domain-containing protein [Acidimicrobiales bacterium]